MKNILELLFLKHSTWLAYIKSFGCNESIAEDYVQDMYIKIYLYSQKTDNSLMYNDTEVNYFFVYVVLKNMYYDNLRKKKKLFIDELTTDIEQDETEYSEDDFYLKSDAIEAWVNNLDKEIEKIEGYTKEKANLIYFKFIYQKIFLENISISELSREVGITYWSLRNTVLIIKENIKNETGNA